MANLPNSHGQMEKLGDLFFERDGKIWHAAKFKKIYLSRKMAKLGDLKPSCDKTGKQLLIVMGQKFSCHVKHLNLTWIHQHNLPWAHNIMFHLMFCGLD